MKSLRDDHVRNGLSCCYGNSILQRWSSNDDQSRQCH
jgi:hypothetical protein